MFSNLKRFIKSDVTTNSPKPEAKFTNVGPPHGMQTMGASLQSKFARGVNYNMKIIIKGDRNVGKTCLHLRLQGHKFREEYLPTDEIQVASIQWSYKTSDDIIKVEVWDVVDKGRKKRKIEGLKLEQGLSEETCLDAEFVDVYKGTHGVIMVFDVTKQWTFDYVEKEVLKVPPCVPILVMANHRDMGHHRTVTEQQVESFVEQQQSSNNRTMRYVESSMRNGFGLKYVHMFFNLPFLYLQRQTLLSQLEKNKEDMEATLQELDDWQTSDKQNYDLFSDMLNNKRREQQDSFAQKAIEEAKQQLSTNNDWSNNKSRGGVNNLIGKSSSFTNNHSAVPIREAPPAHPIPGLNLPLTTNSTTTTTISTTSQALTSPKSAPTTPLQAGGFLGKFLSKKSKQSCEKEVKNVDIPVHDYASANAPLQNVDEFRPEADDVINGFLDDNDEGEVGGDGGKNRKNKQTNIGSDNHLTESDDDHNPSTNPLVAGYQEDFYSSDDDNNKKCDKDIQRSTNNKINSFGNNNSKRLNLSSDDDNDDIGGGSGSGCGGGDNKCDKKLKENKNKFNHKPATTVINVNKNGSNKTSSAERNFNDAKVTSASSKEQTVKTKNNNSGQSAKTKNNCRNHRGSSVDDDNDDDRYDDLKNKISSLELSDSDDDVDVDDENKNVEHIPNKEKIENGVIKGSINQSSSSSPPPPISFNATDIDALEKMFMKKSTKAPPQQDLTTTATTTAATVTSNATIDVASTSTDDDAARKMKKKKKKKKQDDDYNKDENVNTDTADSKNTPKKSSKCGKEEKTKHKKTDKNMTTNEKNRKKSKKKSDKNKKIDDGDDDGCGGHNANGHDNDDEMDKFYRSSVYDSL